MAEYRDKSTLSLNQGHLTCFIGGNFILGGQLLDRPDIKKTGLALTDGCHDSYIRTATRIGPERWSWDSSAVPQGQQDFFAKNGFFITTSYYDLRPETIESYYHGWRLTGNPKYQEWAWDAFLNINSTCRTDAGFSGVRNVNVVGGGEKMDYQGELATSTAAVGFSKPESRLVLTKHRILLVCRSIEILVPDFHL